MQAELERLLLEARADGVARPEILDTFNAQREGEKEYVFGGFQAHVCTLLQEYAVVAHI